MSSHYAGPILPETITCVPTADMVLLVFHLKGADRADLDLLPQAQGPAVYIGFYRTGPEITSAYVGFSTCVANRIVRGTHLSGVAEPDDLFIITAANGAMTPIFAQAGERIVYATLKELTRIRLIGQTPHGAPVGPDQYDRLRIFFSAALLGIRHSGIALTQGSARSLTMGPRTNTDKFGELRGNAIPDGDLYRLAKVGVAASAIANDDTWMVLTGSEIRVDVTSSAGGITRTRHEELLHAGILVPHQPGIYRLRRDMIFETASAAALFVAGSKGVNLNAWDFVSTYRDGRPVLRIVPS